MPILQWKVATRCLPNAGNPEQVKISPLEVNCLRYFKILQSVSILELCFPLSILALQFFNQSLGPSTRALVFLLFPFSFIYSFLNTAVHKVLTCLSMKVKTNIKENLEDVIFFD